MVHSRRSPLYFLTVISAADGQRLSSPPSPICRYVLLNTTCGRRLRAVSRFGIFLLFFFCGRGFAQTSRPTLADRSPTATRRTVASVTGPEAGLRSGSWKGGDGRSTSFSRHDVPRRSWSSTGVSYAASDILTDSTEARLSGLQNQRSFKSKNADSFTQFCFSFIFSGDFKNSCVS